MPIRTPLARASTTPGILTPPTAHGEPMQESERLPAGEYESVQTFANLDGCPLNGVWQMEICDLWGSDNGFVFGWAIQFADSLYPVEN